MDTTGLPRIPLQLSQNPVVASIQIDLNEEILHQFRRDLLEKLHATGARGVILDVSGVEVMEVQLPPELTVREVRDRLAAELPEGLRPWGGDALYTGEKWSVTELQYELRADAGSLPDPDEVAELMARESVPIERRGKEVDLRPLLRTMEHP